MTARTTKLLLLFSGLALSLSLAAQYPSNAIKSRLGYQTTGDGLTFRGSGAPAFSPGSLMNAWMYLDTTNFILYHYKNFQWWRLPGANNGLTNNGYFVQLGGTLTQNTQIESNGYTLDIGKISGAQKAYWQSYGSNPYYAGIYSTDGATESSLSVGNGIWNFETDNSSHISQVGGTATGFSASYLGTFGATIFKMDSARFRILGIGSYATHALATAGTVSNQLYRIDDSRSIFINSGTGNKVSPNVLDNGTYVGILNNKPFSLGQWTTAGRPSGVTGYTGYNTTTAFTEGYFTSQWENYITSTGAANGQVSIFSSAGKTYGTNNLFWDNSNTRLGIGTAIPSQDVHLRKGVAGAVQFSVENTTAGTTAFAGYRLINNTAAVGAIFKLSSTYTTYKNQGANDFGIINQTNGNMSFLNDNGTGNISFATGSLSGTERQLTIEADGDVFIPQKMGLGITPTSKLDLRQDQNAPTRMVVSNQSTGAAAWAGVSMGNSTGGYSFYKLSSGYTTYKTQMANDAGFINTVSGNISLLNDWASGKIIFTSGASSTQHLSIESNGRIALGNMTPNYLLDATSTDAYGLPRGTVAQRPTIVSSTTPFRYNTDSTSLEYGESVGTWRQLATRAYARTMKDGNGIYSGSGTVPDETRAYLSSSRKMQIGQFTGNFSDPLVSRVNAVGLYIYPQFGVQGLTWQDSTLNTKTSLIQTNGQSSLNYEGSDYAATIGVSQGSVQIDYRSASKTHLVNLDSTRFSVTEGLTASTRDTLFKIGIGGTNRGTLRAYKYGAGNKEAADISKTQSNFIAGLATDGTITDYQITRDTFTSNADFTVTATLLSTCQELWVSAEVTGAASDTVNIILPLPSATYKGKKVYVFGDDDNSTWWVATKTLLGNGLYFDIGIDAKPTAQNYAAVTTTTGISGVTYAWICTRRASGTWNWVLITEN